MLERERHDDLIAELRESGARVNLIRDGDVAPSIAAAQPGHRRRHADGDRRHARGRHLGGGDQVSRRRDAGTSLAARRRGARSARRCRFRGRHGADARRPRRGDDVFVAATGVTSGALLRGVRVGAGGVETESIVMRSRSGTVRTDRRLPSIGKVQRLRTRRRTLMAVQELHDDRALDRRRPQRHARRRRVDGDDQEALRLDRGRVDRGEPARLPESAVHDAGLRGLHRRRDPLRRDDPPVRRRRDAVPGAARSRRASCRGSRSTPARRTWPVTRREGDRGPRRAARAASPSTTSSARASQVARGDHDRRRHPDATPASTRTRTRSRGTPRSARRRGSCRSSSPRC